MLARLPLGPASWRVLTRAGGTREDHDPLQAETGRDRDDDPDHWLQRRDGRVQEHLIHRVGRRRPGQGLLLNRAQAP